MQGKRNRILLWKVLWEGQRQGTRDSFTEVAAALIPEGRAVVGLSRGWKNIPEHSSQKAQTKAEECGILLGGQSGEGSPCQRKVPNWPAMDLSSPPPSLQ